MMETTNKYITIRAHIDGKPEESDFDIKPARLSLLVESGNNDIIVKNLYVSIDPYQINQMKSCSSSQKATRTTVALTPGKCSSGHSGLTAYAGFFEVCKPKKGEKVFVSAASGSVGNLVRQYAKLFGCHVVGCSGGKAKVAFLKEKLGFHDAFNYKEETDLKATLKRYFRDGIDMYFDSVGGEMLEVAVANMNAFGRVAACGATSEYIDAGKKAAPDMLDVVYKRITIRGFISIDHMDLFKDFISTTVDHLRAGNIQAIEDISLGLSSIPLAFIGLFRGNNTGKKIVKIADE